MSDAHTPEERAAVKWWRERHPEHAKARLQVVRHDGTVFSYLVEPRDPTSWVRQPAHERTVASLDEIVDAYRKAQDRFHVMEPDPDVSGAPKGWTGVVDESAGGHVAFCRDEETAVLLRDALRAKAAR